MNVNIQNGAGLSGCCGCLMVIVMFSGLLLFMTICGIINW